MSVVAMYHDKKKRTIYAACDGITIAGYDLVSTDSIKLYKGTNCVVGSCGSTFLGQVYPRYFVKLVDTFIKKAKSSEEFYQHIAEFLATNDAWHQHAMQSKQRSPKSYISMLVGCKHGLFLAGAPSYEFVRVEKDYHAIGAGYGYSIGSLHNWKNSKNKENPKEAIKSSVAAACSASAAVTGRIRIETLKV